MNDYAERIGRAIAFIEANLDKALRLEDVAGAACLSAFHFERVFRAMTGETVFSYLRKRRLSRAFDAALGSDRSLIDIALEFRYESAAAFSRAFSAQFKSSPSKIRAKRKKGVYGYYPAIDADRLAHRMEGGVGMEARIERKGPLELLGMYCSNTAKKNGIPRLWGEFIGRARKVEGLLDRGTYAVFEHRGRLAELGKTYEYVYGVWFPASGRESLAAEHFEYHGPDFKGDLPESVTELWIPLA
jgi:AraC family transcriptional regulator